ncbi:hypothetical protein HJ148_17345 [Vibrio parahaemolyticus]|nr:hypothetical protein [Vibrio parahaemolyticus]HCH1963849.1 hypothetical protein [Vibrio parahaemolyticus]
MAKKFNGLGLSGISMACTGLAIVIASPQESLLSAHYMCYVKYGVAIRQILATLLSYLFQILNFS